MRILTTYDDSFLNYAQAFFNSLRYFNKSVPVSTFLIDSLRGSIELAKSHDADVFTSPSMNLGPKPTSRLLKMICANEGDSQEAVAYMDIDIIFQNDIAELENLNPDFLWVLSLREGHQTTLRTWKKHYFTKSTYEFAKESLQILAPDIDPDKALQSPVRNCGVIYGRRHLLKSLFSKAKSYYEKLLEINKKKRRFLESDQLCFVLSYLDFDNIKELPPKFNRMPYHQSYDFKDKSSLLIPDNVILHLNRQKKLGPELISFWSKNEKPRIKLECNTRSGLVLPIMTSKGAERALTKNLYVLASSNNVNTYREEDIGFLVTKKLDDLHKIRDSLTNERPTWDVSCAFMINGFLFLIDHGERVGRRAAWKIAKHTTSDQLAGVFVEQMDEGLDISGCNCPILPLSYGTKQSEMWIKQHVYHDMGINGPKKYNLHFIGAMHSSRKRWLSRINGIENSKIEARGNSQRIGFDEYMKDLAAARLSWCPAGNRPKSHREVEAMCCEVAIVMARKGRVETKPLNADSHYIVVTMSKTT